MINKEYGSDFHRIEFIENTNNTFRFNKNSYFFGSGRNAITALISENYINLKWKRVYIPTYYCETVVEEINKIGIPIAYYSDSPDQNDIKNISNIDFIEGDVLIRMNYYGLRRYRDNTVINIPVLEDHSHGVFSSWAQNSNADWCFASLRKEFPIPDGGVLWSPKNNKLESTYIKTNEHIEIARKRYNAMLLKERFLRGENIEKRLFRDLYIETENKIGVSTQSLISDISQNILSRTPFSELYQIKKNNYNLLCSYLIKFSNYIFKGKDICDSSITPFAFILVLNTERDRNALRDWLIKCKIYPSILWNLSKGNDSISDNFSRRMLSIHIDFRYSFEDIKTISEYLTIKLSDFE